MTPNGQAGMQYPQPLQMSSCTTTVPNSVRNSEPVGHTSRQAAWVQCLHTSDDMSHLKSAISEVASGGTSASRSPRVGIPRSIEEPDREAPAGCSMKATCRHVLAPRLPVSVSYTHLRAHETDSYLV